MSHIIVRPFIVKLSVLGYFPLYIQYTTLYIPLYQFSMYTDTVYRYRYSLYTIVYNTPLYQCSM